MDQKDIKIKELNSLLTEALADKELDKIVEETSVDVVDGTKLPNGIKEKEADESNPEVKTDEVLDTVDAAEDVKGKDNEELAEEADSTEVPEGTKLPMGVKEKEADESNPEVKTAEVLDTVDAAEDVEGKCNCGKDLKDCKCNEEADSTEVPEGTKLPMGVKDKEPGETAANVATDDVLETIDAGEDVEEYEGNNEVNEEVDSTEVPEGTELPDGVLERKPQTTAADVATDDVLETIDAGEDVEEYEGNNEVNEELDTKLDEAIDALNALIESLNEEDSTEIPEGTKLPMGVKDKEPGETSADVATDDVLDTLDASEDVEEYEGNNEVNEEADSTEVPEGTELPMGVKDKEPSETAANVATDDVLDTLDAGEDVEEYEGNNEVNEECDNKECNCVKTSVGVCPTCGKKDCECKKENNPGCLTGVKTVDAKNLEQYKEYKNLKEAIKLGRSYFDTEDKVNTLKEQVAVLMAKENEDLLYEELVKYESRAKAIREHIEKKYSIVSNNRVDNLLESMEIVEAKAAARKNDMFKKLNEQQELNKVIANTEELSVDEVAFKN